MKVRGLTGIYKKVYLGNDMYRFDYSHYIDGYVDSETGEFYDEFNNNIPFIRNLEFLNSKDSLGQCGFIPYREFPKVYPDMKEPKIDEFIRRYNRDSKSRMLLVTVLTDKISMEKNTVLTEIDLNDIHRNAINYHLEFVNSQGEKTYGDVSSIKIDGNIEDIVNYIKAGRFSIDELRMLYDKYKNSCDEPLRLISLCDDILDNAADDYDEGIERKNDFLSSNDFDVPSLIEMLKNHELRLNEVNLLKQLYSSYVEKFRELISSILNEIDRQEKEIEESKLSENVVEAKEPEYSLDDLKKLKAVIKEYLIGQDEPLRRLVSELSRMKDKDFEDNVGILLSGDSGVGKTFMVQLLAKFLDIPFVRVDSTSLTVPGYVGKDLEECVWELYENSGRDKEKAEHGIVFFDEIDKKGSNRKDDISGMGVLNHLLALLDGTEINACKNLKSLVNSEEVRLNTKHMIVIVAGSFADVYKDKRKPMGITSSSSDNSTVKPDETPKTDVFVQKAMMSGDFMNRLPIRIRLNSLTSENYEDNLKNGKDSPIKWEAKSFSKYGVKLSVTPSFIKKAGMLSLKEDSGFRGSKGIILTATSIALDEVKEKKGQYEEIILTEETLDNPHVYTKVLKNKVS